MYSQEEILKNNLKLPIHFFYCVKPEDLTQIGGVWGSQYFSKVEIFVNKCKNDTLDSSDKPCKPLEEINNIMADTSHAYFNPSHPNHEIAVEKMRQLHEKVYGK